MIFAALNRISPQVDTGQRSPGALRLAFQSRDTTIRDQEPRDGTTRQVQHRTDQALRYRRAAVHVVPDRGSVHGRLRCRCLRALHDGQQQRADPQAALAVRAPALLPFALLLLRLHEEGDPARRAGRDLPRVARTRNRNAGSPVRPRSRSRAIALRRRHAHILRWRTIAAPGRHARPSLLAQRR